MAASCSFNTPTAVLVKKQRIYSYNAHGKLVERLAVFVLLEDSDGKNDYKELKLREDATGLEWVIHRENTVFLHDTGYDKNTQWVGSNKFRYPRRFFPTGAYTIIASDLGGNKVETVFTLPEPQSITGIPFDFTLENNHWRLKVVDDSVCTSFSIIMLSADLQPLSVQRVVPDASGLYGDSLDALQEPASDARYIQCFGEDAEQSIGFLSKPLQLR